MQDRDQDHDRGDINATAEKAQRRRCRTRPTTLPSAAEAEAPVMLGAELQRPPTRLAIEVGHVEPGAAVRATLGLPLVGEIAITSEQEVVESDIGKYFCVQG